MHDIQDLHNKITTLQRIVVAAVNATATLSTTLTTSQQQKHAWELEGIVSAAGNCLDELRAMADAMMPHEDAKYMYVPGKGLHRLRAATTQEVEDEITAIITMERKHAQA